MLTVNAASMDNINKVFSVANASKLYGEKYSWFAGTKVRMDKIEELQGAPLIFSGT